MPVWSALPPEVNSARLISGPGAAPMLARAQAYAELAAATEAQAGEVTAAMGELSSTYVGAAGTANQAAHAPYIAWLHQQAAQHTEASARAANQAAAHSSAVAMMPPLAEIAANRAAEVQLQAANIATGGAMTGALLANEAAYMEMWMQAAAAMDVYAAQTSANTPVQQATPAKPIVGGGGGSSAAAGSAVTQPLSAVESVAGSASQGMRGGAQMTSLVAQSATQAASRAASLPMSMMNGGGANAAAGGQFGQMLSGLSATGKLGPGSVFSKFGFSGSRLASPLLGEPAGFANNSGIARGGAFGGNLGVARGAMPELPSFTMPGSWSPAAAAAPAVVSTHSLGVATIAPDFGGAGAVHHSLLAGTTDPAAGSGGAATPMMRPAVLAGGGEAERHRTNLSPSINLNPGPINHTATPPLATRASSIQEPQPSNDRELETSAADHE